MFIILGRNIVDFFYYFKVLLLDEVIKLCVNYVINFYFWCLVYILMLINIISSLFRQYKKRQYTWNIYNNFLIDNTNLQTYDIKSRPIWTPKDNSQTLTLISTPNSDRHTDRHPSISAWYQKKIALHSWTPPIKIIIAKTDLGNNNKQLNV